jgi:DNA modification methylase
VSGEGILPNDGRPVFLGLDLASGPDMCVEWPLPRRDGYRDFLEAKIATPPSVGLPCEIEDTRAFLSDGRPAKDHVRHIVRWAVRGGRRGIFANFGLHKTMMQLEIGRLITSKADCRGLIVLPLGVRREFLIDARLLDVPVSFVQSDDEVRSATPPPDMPAPLYLTNYESVREGKIDVSRFGWASLDEASILRSFGSKTYQEFLPLFDLVPYRHVATATPSPNRYKELIHYAGFLGIMDTGQALTRFFQRNSERANDLTLYPHKEAEFWLWLNSWGVFLQRPSDLGFSDEGYDLPPITVRYHSVTTDLASGAGEESNGQGRLMRDAALGVIDAAREKRATLPARIEKVDEIVAAAPGEHFIIWHDLEDERRAIEETLPDAKAVFGAQDLDAREEIIADFAEGRLPLLAAKPVMLGSGTNLQRHCHRAIFAGVGFKFNDLIQAIHRLHRFQQQRPVEIDIIHAETEGEVLRTLQEKWARHDELTARMSKIIREFGLNHEAAAETLRRSIGVERRSMAGTNWTMVHNDCVDELRRLPDSSVDQIITSIPFGNHYEYCESYNDFGHTDDHEHFFRQMDFLTPELLRILKPGRVACIHVKDRIQFASVTGMTRPTVEPFHADTIAHFRRHGFGYMGLRFIATDVVRENNQTYRLTYKELKKDSTKMGSGSPEFLLLFFKLPTDRSNGYADEPVTKDPSLYSLARWQIDADALWRSSGNRPVTAAELALMPPDALARAFPAWSVQDVYDHDDHVAVGEGLEERRALPRTFSVLKPGTCRDDVWTDVARMQTLNGEQTRRGLENHICPLQFDIVDRAVRLYSNPGDLILDPFAGLGTVPMRAVLAGRRGYGVELNPDYFRDALHYCSEAERQRATPSLFDLLDAEAA